MALSGEEGPARSHRDAGLIGLVKFLILLAGKAKYPVDYLSSMNFP